MSDYLALWHGEYSKIDSVSDSFVAYEPSAPGREVPGPDAFEAYVRELRTAFPDFTITVKAALEDDEDVPAGPSSARRRRGGRPHLGCPDGGGPAGRHRRAGQQ